MTTLAGRTVLVTRAEDDAPAWAARLRELGATPVVLPCLVCEPLHDPATARELAAALDGARYLALTSRRGVEAAAALLPSGVPAATAIAVVGPATADAARAAFGRVDLVAARGTGASLAEDLLAALPPEERAGAAIAVAAADRAEHHLEGLLEPHGIAVRRVTVYRTVPAPAGASPASLDALGVDTVLLASPSAVTGLVHRALVPPHVHVITIGPTTTHAARAAGLSVAAEARRPSLEGLLEAIP